MSVQTTPFEYMDKAFGYNLVQAFTNVTLSDEAPNELKRFLLRPQNKMIHFGSLEKQGAKAFRTMVEKRSSDRKIIPSPLVVVHREVGSTNDKLDYLKEALQYKDILQGFQAQVLPTTFTFTIQLFARSDQRGVLEILSMLITAWLYEHYQLTVPHVVKWTEDQVEQQTEMEIPFDISKMDIDNPSWTSVIDGHYLGVERGLDVNTKIILSDMITPSIIDFSFVLDGIQSL